jgi:5-(carboxyamino)imidazole ribonucleotide synthase
VPPVQARVTVLGGGQLGWMLGLAGIPLGCEFTFLDPGSGATARAVGDLIVGALDDVSAARRAAEHATVITYEWEGVPAATARALATHAPVYPPPDALDVAQDRVVEKTKLRELGIETAPFVAVDTVGDLHGAVAEIGLPAILKTRRGGYDGKGQALLRDASDVESAGAPLLSVPCVLEGFVAFDRELSIVAVRGRDGEIRCWPAVENHHREGILRLTRAPAPGLDDALQGRAEAAIRPLLTDLDYVGVCCVELFDVGDRVLANEIAPRVHNSGHWTIEGAETSQFENHLRAILGLPLGSTAPRGPSAMVNCIGAMPGRDEILRVPGAHLHDYAKDPRAGRKVGHVTVTAPEPDELETRLNSVIALCDGAVLP